MPRVEPIYKGLAGAIGTVAFTAAFSCWGFASFPAASPELLRSLAMIGATFVLAYVVETSWLISVVPEGHRDENRGYLVGTGIAGLVGVALALLVAEHRAAGHDNLIDAFGLAWSTTSLLILGGTLVLRPLLVDRHRRLTPPDPE